MTIKFNKIILQAIVHVAAWLCFLMLPFVFFPRPKDGPFIPDQYISFYFLLTSFMYVSFYYLNYFLLIPKLLERKRVAVYVLLIIALLIFFGTFPRLYRYLSDSHSLPPIPWQSGRSPNLAAPLLSGGTIAIFLLVFVISTGVKVVSQWFQFEQKTRQVENEKLNTELSFLKSQINPHFLFNTLNNIYSLAEAGSDKTGEAVMKLSSIMRYILTEAKNDCVPLEKEIQFTMNYIEMQKLRLTNKSKVDFSITGDPIGKKVSPLIFLPFVENAFKYGVSTREPSPICIHLNIKDNELEFQVKNNKYQSSLLKPAETTGIGITNIKRRLELLYHNRYKLSLNDEKTTYGVDLNLHL
ncbi:MAG TPA: sensor histidine kinase [Puia sp.]|nr:sensor histidine kinase [Puia sp.]